jgi:membrane protease YdiL (CAAX protease family)
MSPAIDDGMEAAGAEQHSLLQSVVLHLLPGILILTFFVVAAPLAESIGAPSMLGYILAVLLVQIPLQLGLLLYLGRRRNGRLSLQGIVLYREPMPVWQYVVLAAPCVVWLFVITSILFIPLDTYLIESLFSWLPEWFFQMRFMEVLDQYSTPSLVVMLALLWAVAIPGPLVEELYFRGYLLPRISCLGGWAPLINTVLFSLYHFCIPWQNLGRIAGFLPMTYAVWWNKNIYLGIIVHCSVIVVTFALATAGILATSFFGLT